MAEHFALTITDDDLTVQLNRAEIAVEAALGSIYVLCTKPAPEFLDAAGERTDDGLPVHSFQSRIEDLATVTQIVMAMPHQPDDAFELYPQFTSAQARALDLLEVAVTLWPVNAQSSLTIRDSDQPLASLRQE
jgi:hypothetical protein